MSEQTSFARTLVDSSCIAAVGYCSTTGSLEVEFLSGAVYRYDRVPIDIYNGLLRAESKGAFFSRFVKNIYPFKRMNS